MTHTAQTPRKPTPRLGRDYWRLWWANTISSTGDGAFLAALPLLAVTITRDPRLVSVVTAAEYLPWMVLSLPVGALVDRHDRATLMWRAQAVQAALVVAVTILVVVRHAEIALLAAAALGIGSAQIAGGLRWLARHRLLRVVAALLGVGNFANQMGQAVLVLLATQTLHVTARGYGLLLASSAAGSVAGGLVNPVLTRRLGMLPSLIIAGAVEAAAFVGIGLAPCPSVVALMLACQGFTVTMWNVVTVSLRQRIVPGNLLGRVNSVYRMLGWGLMPFGALAGGFVARAAGLRAPYVVAGLLTGLAVAAAVPFLLAAERAVPGV